MAAKRLGVRPTAPARKEIGAEKRNRKRRRKELERPNKWWALLRTAAVNDLEKRGPLPDLRPSEILDWADAYHARTGEWPTWESGPIPEAPGETWSRVYAALYQGSRGLPGGTTLPRLLKGYLSSSTRTPRSRRLKSPRTPT